MQEESERWRAVRAKSDRPRLLGAGVENAARREIIYVANPSMATFLADSLNAVERGEGLPEAGKQHRPPRFQLAHDPTGFAPGTAVVYMNRGKGRIVARASDDETARLTSRILNNVDYPMVAGALVPQAGVIGDAPSELPDSIVAPPKRRRR